MRRSTPKLASYDNSWYHPGRSIFWQSAWFFVGLPLLRCSVIPFSNFRVTLLRFFGATIGTGVTIKPGVRVKYPWRLRIGNDCWIGEDCWIDNLADVDVSNDVCISQGAFLCTGNHDWSDPSFGLKLGNIVIHDGCWVGAMALIAPGITMGAGSVASAGSLIHRSLGEFEIHSGNPAVFTRIRSVGSTDKTPNPLAANNQLA